MLGKWILVLYLLNNQHSNKSHNFIKNIAIGEIGVCGPHTAFCVSLSLLTSYFKNQNRVMHSTYSCLLYDDMKCCIPANALA